MRKLLEEALIRPTKIMLTNPAIAFANFFTCIIYGLYYSFFESFPRIFMYSYHFTLPQIGLACTSIAIGGVLGVVVYLPWALKWLRQVQGDKVERAEDALRAALPACFLVPVGLFVFGMSSLSHHSLNASLLNCPLPSSQSLTMNSMDIQRDPTLAPSIARRYPRDGRNIRHTTMSLDIHNPSISKPRSIIIRWQRLFAIDVCFCCDFVLQAYV